jgi:hypothetical protein
MKPVRAIVDDNNEMDMIANVCCGVPRGDELPQVAGVEDILLDIYSDMLNVPREYAAGHFHHQYEDSYDFDNSVH